MKTNRRTYERKQKNKGVVSRMVAERAPDGRTAVGAATAFLGRAANAARAGISPGKTTIREVNLAWGLGRNVPIMMFDGTQKRSQDIRVGDILMGPDSRGRCVLAVETGVAEMYSVTPIKGDPIVMSGGGQLSLRTKRVVGGRKRTKMQVVSMTIDEIMRRGKSFRRASWLYRAAVEFAPTPVALDPYFLGVWLGDGTWHLPVITTADPEVVDFLEEFAERFPGVELVTHLKPRNLAAAFQLSCKAGGKNPITKMLRDLRLIKNKHVPAIYLRNDRQTRLAVLSGLMDSDGYLSNGGYDFITKVEQLARDTAFLARSLGFSCYIRPCRKTNTTTGRAGEYYRLSICGDVGQIPCRVPRRQAGSRTAVRADGIPTRNVLAVGYSVTPRGHEPCVGFSVDRDGLVLLNDFTVVQAQVGTDLRYRIVT